MDSNINNCVRISFYNSFQTTNKPILKTLIKTEIKPISVYDEAEYRVYNSVINKIDNSLTALVKKKNFKG